MDSSAVEMCTQAIMPKAQSEISNCPSSRPVCYLGYFLCPRFPQTYPESILKIAQQDATRVHKTVTTASGTGHIFCATTSLQRGQASCTVPEAVVAVLCTPDDGCG